MEIALWSSIFVASLIALIKSADFFTTSAEKIGLHYKIPPFIIGVTILALGTSLPELATSIISSLKGHSEIVVGNVVGSNIANILLVLGMTAIIAKRLNVSKDILGIDLPLLLSSTLLLYFTTADGKFTYIDGSICLFLLIAYIMYNIKSERKVSPPTMEGLKKLKKEEKKEKLKIKHPIILIISGIALYFSSEYAVESIIKLSEIFKIGTEIIAVSAVALGTSLPELVVSIIAAKKGKADIAIGNITGSNIFNALGVMGVPAIISGSLIIPADIVSFTIPALVFITILYSFITMDKQITKWEGFALLSLYVAFIGKTFGLI
jgi:cation:H+ antiporter